MAVPRALPAAGLLGWAYSVEMWVTEGMLKIMAVLVSWVVRALYSRYLCAQSTCLTKGVNKAEVGEMPIKRCSTRPSTSFGLSRTSSLVKTKKLVPYQEREREREFRGRVALGISLCRWNDGPKT
jgi:hypothetical protein